MYHIYKDKAQKRKYHTSNTNSIENPVKTIGLLVEDQKNLTIEGNGSLFMMYGNMMALAVVHSENVELKNCAWDFAVPTVSEMTVQTVGEANGKKYVDYYIPTGFPYQITGNTIRWTSELSPYTGEPYWTATGIHNSYGIIVYQLEDESLTRSIDASDLNWTSATVGYGDSVHKDKNHNNTTITLADAAGKPVTFEKGLGTHAESIIKYNVEGKGFTAIDGYAGLDCGQYNAAYGSVQFQIFADDINIFDSGVMRQKTPMQEI